MKLIKEIHQDLEYITEEKSGGKQNTYIKGIFMQSEQQNRNGRVYPKSVLEKELQRYQNMISEKRSLGELGHPPNPQINLNNVSHLITNLQWEGNDIIGTAKILDTPMGKIAKNFIEEGVRLGVSSRGLGSLKERNGVNEVQDDFHLATVDIVSDPSGPECFVNGIMEGTEWALNNGQWILLKNDVNQIIKETKYDKNKREIEILEFFNKFLNNIK